MEIEIEHTTEGDHDVLAVRGELDLSSYTTLRDRISDLISAGRTKLVIDLAATEFLDSTALGALIGGRRRAHAAGGSFVIACANANLLRLFNLTRLDLVFTVYPSLAAWREVHQPTAAPLTEKSRNRLRMELVEYLGAQLDGEEAADLFELAAADPQIFFAELASRHKAGELELPRDLLRTVLVDLRSRRDVEVD
ncbi:anti-anti-sigma factor [Marmoricola sp. OAE513]|uniref:STAS domain-containing protein n=1 Tax=Marmoricola sp. OAE513 TaxID=2817894 RepID=UPI001AE32CF0